MNVNTEQLKDVLRLGLKLIPIRRWDDMRKGEPVGKVPRDAEWPTRRYTKDELLDWIKQGGNVGVRLSADLVVVDVDPKNDAEGRDAEEILVDMEEVLGIDLHEAPTVRTGSGGYHIYLRKPEDAKVWNSIDLLGRHVEFKSRGRQVLAAGSKHPSGQPYEWIRKAREIPECPLPLLERIRKPEVDRSQQPGARDNLTLKQVKGCLAQLNPEDFRDYDKWRNLLFAVHYSTSGSDEGRELFTRWSTSDAEYADSGPQIAEFWAAASDARSDARTERTLFWHVFNAGGSIPLDMDTIGEIEEEEPEERQLGPLDRDKKGFIKATIAENVIAAARYLGIGVQEDVFSGRRFLIDQDGTLEKHFPSMKHGEEMSDRALELASVVLKREIQHWTGDPSRQTMRRAREALTVQDHPLQRWLESLTWDGKERLDTWLIEASQLEDSLYTRAVSRTMIMAAVGRAMKPGIKFDTMIVLEGPQGGNKSKLIRWLGGQWSSEGLPPIAGHYKDVVSAMRGKWLIEIPELAAMKKADIDVLKAFLSQVEDRARLPYEEETRTFPRQCIFVGTTNDEAYLRDITGNRRFLPLQVGRIEDVSVVPREQIWAEALHRWKQSPDEEEITLPRLLWETAKKEQEQRRIRDPWEDILEEWLGAKWKDEYELTTDSIMFDALRLDKSSAGVQHSKRLSQVMQSLGWERARLVDKDGVRVRGYRRRQQH